LHEKKKEKKEKILLGKQIVKSVPLRGRVEEKAE